MMWYYSIALVVCYLLAQVCAICESGNCTDAVDESVEKVELVEPTGSNAAKLAWLLTPAVLGLGVMFLIYKCCKDGLCNCRRLRQRAVLEYHREHGYIPLSQVVLHTTTASGQAPADPHNLPPLPPGLRRHLVVIHNQTFCITLRDTGGDGGEGAGACPANEQCVQGDTAAAAPPYQRHVCPPHAPHHGDDDDGAHGPAQPHPPAIPVKPPTYEEATDGPGGGRPPRYSEACGEGLPEAEHKVPSPQPQPPRQVRFDTTGTGSATAAAAAGSSSQQPPHRRRRHFSAQERRFLEELLAAAAATADDGEASSTLRQRCFSFTALRDAFRSGHYGGRRHSTTTSTERHILLHQHTTTELFTGPPTLQDGDEDEDVFLSVELLGPPPVGPLPDNVTVVTAPEDLAGLLSSSQQRPRHASGPTHGGGGGHGTGGRVRQRHASAPDPTHRKPPATPRHSHTHTQP